MVLSSSSSKEMGIDYLGVLLRVFFFLALSFLILSNFAINSLQSMLESERVASDEDDDDDDDEG
jgi:hypothetical protein